MKQKPATCLMKKDTDYLLVRPGAEKDDGIVRLCWITDQGAIIWHDDEDIHWVLSLSDVEDKCLL